MERKKSFALGYSLVLHSLLTYLIYGATAVTGLNIIVPAFSKMNGLDQNAVLAANTIGSFISAFACLALGKLILFKGIRFTTAVSAIAGGILGFGLLGFVRSIVGYAVCTIFIRNDIRLFMDCDQCSDYQLVAAQKRCYNGDNNIRNYACKPDSLSTDECY